MKTIDDLPDRELIIAQANAMSQDSVSAFTNDKEGENWEGVSLLRPAYKPWFMKGTLEKIDAIAHERQGLGVP